MIEIECLCCVLCFLLYFNKNAWTWEKYCYWLWKIKNLEPKFLWQIFWCNWRDKKFWNVALTLIYTVKYFTWKTNPRLNSCFFQCRLLLVAKSFNLNSNWIKYLTSKSVLLIFCFPDFREFVRKLHNVTFNIEKSIDKHDGLPQNKFNIKWNETCITVYNTQLSLHKNVYFNIVVGQIYLHVSNICLVVYV